MMTWWDTLSEGSLKPGCGREVPPVPHRPKTCSAASRPVTIRGHQILINAKLKHTHTHNVVLLKLIWDSESQEECHWHETGQTTEPCWLHASLFVLLLKSVCVWDICSLCFVVCFFFPVVGVHLLCKCVLEADETCLLLLSSSLCWQVLSSAWVWEFSNLASFLHKILLGVSLRCFLMIKGKICAPLCRAPVAGWLFCSCIYKKKNS